jgi:hypothetical protein
VEGLSEVESKLCHPHQEKAQNNHFKSDSNIHKTSIIVNKLQFPAIIREKFQPLELSKLRKTQQQLLFILSPHRFSTYKFGSRPHRNQSLIELQFNSFGL